MEQKEVEPATLQEVLDSEKVDFFVRSERNESKNISLSKIYVSIGVTLIASLILMESMGMAEVVTKKTKPTIDDFQKIILPIFVSFVLIAGSIVTAIKAFISLNKTGGQYVGTADKLYHYSDTKLQTYFWKEFTGNIEIDSKKGEISMTLRYGTSMDDPKNANRITPDTVFLSGLPNVFEIEKICRKRIKENDPTVALNSTNT
jgi:hypothetical protein